MYAQGVAVETPPVHDELARTVSWRVRADAPTREPLRWRLGRDDVEKRFVAVEDDRLVVVTPVRPGRALGDRLHHGLGREVRSKSER